MPPRPFVVPMFRRVGVTSGASILRRFSCGGMGNTRTLGVFSVRLTENSIALTENPVRATGKRSGVKEIAGGAGQPSYWRMASRQASMSHVGVDVAPQMPTVCAPLNQSKRMWAGSSTR